MKQQLCGMRLAGRGVLSATIVLLATFAGYAQDTSNEQVLEELRAMRNRIDELEQTVKSQQSEIERLKTQAQPPPGPAAPKEDAEAAALKDLDTRLSTFKEELIDTLAGEESPLDISAFFDVTLQAPNERDDPFEFGDFEIDLEYPFDDHYAISAALVWGDDVSEVGFGVVDYHWFDDTVPARGRIFDEPGFHIQAGRFDLPFGVDYQYFAAPDRPNISAPLTTERIQLGGYNSDGARVYGTWRTFDYALYATDSLYGDDGGVVGGRVGFFPSRDPYRLHRFGSTRAIELGVSYLQDIDKHGDARDRVYGADLTLNYGILQLISEWMKRDSDLDSLGWSEDYESGLSLGEMDETAYHVSLVADIEEYVKRPVNLFARFDAWDPDYDSILDLEDESLWYSVKNTKRLTFGVGYNFTETVSLKLEYYDFLGGGTHEPEFDDRGAILQLVAGF